MRLFLFLFGLLVFGSCKELEILEPLDFSGPDSLPKKIIVSQVNIPVEIDLDEYLKEIKQYVPVVFSDSQNHCEGLSYKYSFQRSAMRFSLLSNKIDLRVNGGMGLRVDYCPKCVSVFNKTSCVIPRVYASCGENGEKKRKLEITVSSDININEKYEVVSTTSLKDISFIDPCEFTFLKFDVSDIIEKSIKSELKNTLTQVDLALKQIDIKSIVNDSWNNLQKGLELGSLGVFYINPKNLFLNSFSFKERSLLLNVGASINPQIIPVKREFKTTKLPPLQRGNDTSSNFSVFSDLFLSFDQVNSLLNNSIKGRSLIIQGRFFYIDSLLLSSSDNKNLYLKLFFKGSKRGVLYLKGEPSFNHELSRLKIENIDFTLKTKSVLLKSAKWLLHHKVLKQLYNYSEINLAPVLQSQIDGFNIMSKEMVFDGLSFASKIDSLKPVDYYFNPSGVFLRFLVSGSLKLKVN